MITRSSPRIYLASRSPRRRALLEQIGVAFTALAEPLPEVDEAAAEGEAPLAYVERVTRAKAEAGWRCVLERALEAAPVLAADTTVVIDDRVLGKPATRAEAADMLGALSGRSHEVLTAVALQRAQGVALALSRSAVRFRALSRGEIDAYVGTGEADDKAGAYAIQGRAAQFVAELRGSYSGVVGLPLYETAQLIEGLARA